MTDNGLSFGETHFGTAELGNTARTRRLVTLADQLCGHPGGTLPQKIPGPAALQAAYRLMQREEVTHASVLAPHLAHTRQAIAEHDGPLLVVCDSTELDYTSITSLTELGQIGDGHGRGYICHNVLVVDPATRQTLGLAEQILHTRARNAKRETRVQRRRRPSRESRLWPRGTGSLPGDAKLVVVCDRGGDTFEELEHEARSGRRFVIRAQHERRILCGHTGVGPKQGLKETIRQQPAGGSFKLAVEAKSGRPARQAQMSMSWVAVRLAPPRSRRGEHSREPLPVWVVRVWEVQPPAGEKGLEWLLLTNEPVESFDDAWRVTEWYECRWVVEEYHKAQKTGCGIEQLQFTDKSRLEPMIALLSVVALTLLHLRDASRSEGAKITPATTLMALEYVEVLSLWRHGKARRDWTVHDFFYALARLGGHQNRKGDKHPGWQVLWRGWDRLQLLVAGARTQHRQKNLA